MRAQQSKFLASFNSVEHDVLGDSKVGEEACPEIRTDSVEHAQDVCSLCHDPQSKNPLSYLILLQVSYCLSYTYHCLVLGPIVGLEYYNILSSIDYYYPFLPLCEF